MAVDIYKQPFLLDYLDFYFISRISLSDWSFNARSALEPQPLVPILEYPGFIFQAPKYWSAQGSVLAPVI